MADTNFHVQDQHTSAHICIFINTVSNTFTQVLFNLDPKTWSLQKNLQNSPHVYTDYSAYVFASLAITISNYNQYWQNKLKAIIDFMMLQEKTYWLL